jgi:hypothetical protein
LFDRLEITELVRHDLDADRSVESDALQHGDERGQVERALSGEYPAVPAVEDKVGADGFGCVVELDVGNLFGSQRVPGLTRSSVRGRTSTRR